ncbi:MAG: isochorismatase family protein [Ferrovibrio sp.]|uniref:isochorismatase family protein n=1 Tax=Ferrovibrio sp. TaxID=1917215 RepID=UPI00391D26F0
MPPAEPDLRPSGARHDSSLPRWAVEKMIRRRNGRRYAFEDLRPARTALIVIDLMQGYVDGTPCAASIIAPINALATALRRAGGLIAWVLPDPAMQDMPHLQALWGEDHIRKTTAGMVPGMALATGLQTDAADLKVSKRAYSAFFPGKSPLPDLLASRGIDTILIAGVLTNICCESSARDAMTLGYRVVMVSDANAARSDAEHQSALYNVMRNFGDVRESSELIALFDAMPAAVDQPFASG